MPAAVALFLKVVLPISPLLSEAVLQPSALLHMKPSGLGLRAARKPRKLAACPVGAGVERGVAGVRGVLSIEVSQEGRERRCARWPA